MLVAYWHRGGIEIYRLSNGRVNKFAAGSLGDLKPVKTFGKKILIVGRDLLFYTRKRYPPASGESIKKAVQAEINEMFPIKNPAQFFRISERTDTYTLTDVWAWEQSEYKKLREIFPFTHCLPEDAAFLSEEPEITIFGSKGITYLIAHSKDGFHGVSSFRGIIGIQQVEVLLKSLGRFSESIKKINLHNPNLADISGLQASGIKLFSVEEKGYPVCVSNIGRLNLKIFRVKAEEYFLLNMNLAIRVFIYLLIAYSMSLYLTNRNYTRSIKEINAEMDKLSRDLTSISMGQKDAMLTDIAAELDKKVKDRSLPLAVMENVAGYLPDKSYVTKILLSENKLELSILSKEPLNVLRAIGSAEGVKAVKLKGALNKNTLTGEYNLVLMVEMR